MRGGPACQREAHYSESLQETLSVKNSDSDNAKKGGKAGAGTTVFQILQLTDSRHKSLARFHVDYT